MGEATLEDVAPDSVPARPGYAAHVKPILDYRCAGCHHHPPLPAAQLDGGMPGDLAQAVCGPGAWDYASYDGAVRCFPGLADSVFARGTMPPGAAPRVTSRGQAVLRRWRDTGFSP